MKTQIDTLDISMERTHHGVRSSEHLKDLHLMTTTSIVDKREILVRTGISNTGNGFFSKNRQCRVLDGDGQIGVVGEIKSTDKALDLSRFGAIMHRLLIANV